MPVLQISTTKTAFADELLRGDLAPEARQLIEAIRDDWRADERGAVGRAVRDKMVGVGPTRGRELEKTVLPAYLEGTQRLTLTALIYKYRIQQVLKSFPLAGTPAKRPTALDQHPGARRWPPTRGFHGSTPTRAPIGLPGRGAASPRPPSQNST